MRDDPIFVIGIERSGSTLLQRLLNSVDGVLIYGEHGALLCHSAILYRQAHDFSKEFSADISETVAEITLRDPKMWIAKCGAYQLDRINKATCAMVEAVANPFGNQKIRWGFKEVRYGSETFVRTMLINLYPKCKIVHTVRHPVDHVLSKMKKGWFSSLEECMHWYVKKVSVFSEGASLHPDRIKLLRYEDMTETSFCALFEWLGLKWGPVQKDVLSTVVDTDARSSTTVALTPEQYAYIFEKTKALTVYDPKPV